MRTFLFLCLSMIAAPARPDFYIEGGVSAIRSIGERPPNVSLVATPSLYADGSTRYVLEYRAVPTYSRYDINDVRNPYGSLAVGYDWQWPRWTLDLRLSHDSSITVNDRGREAISLNVRWYPFER